MGLSPHVYPARVYVVLSVDYMNLPGFGVTAGGAFL